MHGKISVPLQVPDSSPHGRPPIYRMDTAGGRRPEEVQQVNKRVATEGALHPYTCILAHILQDKGVRAYMSEKVFRVKCGKEVKE